MSSVNSNVSDNAPLSMLAASLMENEPSPSPARVRVGRDPIYEPIAHAHHHHHDHHEQGFGAWSFVFGFLLLALVFYFLYFALRPSFVLEQDCDSRSKSSSDCDDRHDGREISNGRLLGAAVLSALILIFVLWIASCLFRRY